MLVDGAQIARDILDDVRVAVASQGRVPRMTAITCAPQLETQKYLTMKQRKAAAVGISLSVVELPADATTEAVVACVEQVAKESDGVVVQLPLPTQIDRDAVLSAVSVDKDPDGFAYGVDERACLPPVVGAIDAISRVHDVAWEGKRVTILGEGRLVGKPAAYYARQRGAQVTVCTRETYDEGAIQATDIIVSGIGQPHYVTPSQVQQGVIVFDAGTSEDGGVLSGDVDPAVATKAALLTPMPGGIGPITIACLLRNLVELTRQ